MEGKKEEKESKKKDTSFWGTLPGLLTGLAAVLTAIGGLITGLYAAGIFPRPTPTPLISPSATSNVVLPIETPEPPKTPTKAITLTTVPTEGFIASPTITPQVAKIYDFSACPERCTGSNATRVYPEAATRVFVQWNFENIPIGADYARVWTMNGQEWIRYHCTWPGPDTGTDMVTLLRRTLIG